MFFQKAMEIGLIGTDQKGLIDPAQEVPLKFADDAGLFHLPLTLEPSGIADGWTCVAAIHRGGLHFIQHQGERIEHGLDHEKINAPLSR